MTLLDFISKGKSKGKIEQKIEAITNKLNLVSREEFEVQKKLIEKLQKDLSKIKNKKSPKKL